MGFFGLVVVFLFFGFFYCVITLCNLLWNRFYRFVISGIDLIDLCEVVSRSGFVLESWSDEERGLTDKKKFATELVSFSVSDVKCDCHIYQEGKCCLLFI